MSGTTKALWLVTVLVAFGLGWFAAMQVVRTPAFADEQDAYERFTHAFTLNDTMDRMDLVGKLVRNLTPASLPGAARALYDGRKEIFNSDLQMVMWYWAREDPRGMLEEIKDWPEMRTQRIAAGEAVYWVTKQEGLAAGRTLFDSLPNHQRDRALPQLVLATIEEGGMETLTEIVDAYDWRDERDVAAGIVVGRLIETGGGETVAEWVESLPDGPGTSNDLKPVAFRAAQSELMRRDHFEFLEGWLERVAEEPWARNGGWRTIGVHLAKRDPMRAIEWAYALRPDQDRHRVIQETVRTFAMTDRVGALQWILERPPSTLLDPAAARLVMEFKDRRPGVALEMLERIQDPVIRSNAYDLAERSWKSRPEASRAKLMDALAEISRTPPSSGTSPTDATEDKGSTDAG